MLKPKDLRSLKTRLLTGNALMKDAAVQRMHWGCGPKGKAGWINVDILKGDGIDITCDILDGLPLANDSLDYIVGIHVLNEIAYPNVPLALKELHRVLKVGGVLRLSLPDLEKNIHAFQNKTENYFLIPDEEAARLGGKFIAQILWYGAVRSFYTSDSIEEKLRQAGFSDVKQCSHQTTQSQFGNDIVELDDRPKESLFVEAIK